MSLLTIYNNKIGQYYLQRRRYRQNVERFIQAIKPLKKVKLLTVLGLALALYMLIIPLRAAAATDSTTVPEYIRAKTEVAVSNYPLFLLSEAVTKGAPSAKLLLDAGDVGHHGSLSPSDMKTINDSRYVVWFGKDLETNLDKTLKDKPNAIALFDLQGFNLLPLRDIKGNRLPETIDPHIWLDPNNAKAITRALGAIYSRANPKYKEVYAKNVSNFAKEMNAAVKVVDPMLSVSSSDVTLDRPYWAYHDAFQYIEPTLHLTLVGALTADHHLPPKASQFQWLKKTRPKRHMCIVLQSNSNRGVTHKLDPVRHTIQQEDMSHSEDFIAGWKAMTDDIKDCMAQ